jgi:hypothetical protein
MDLVCHDDIKALFSRSDKFIEIARSTAVTSIVTDLIVTTENDDMPLGYGILMKKPVGKILDQACYSPPGTNLIYDPLTRSCREALRCAMGRVEWNETCVLDPFNEAYTKPSLGPDGYLAVEFQIELNKSLTLITKNGSGRDNLVEAFHKAFASYLMLSPMAVVNLTVEFSERYLVSIPLIGGKELTYQPDTNIYVTFHKMRQHRNNISADVYDTVAFFREHPHFNLGSVAAFTVYNHPVTLPLRCGKGDLVRLPYDNNLHSYLQYIDVDITKVVVEIDINDQVQFILCDRYAAKFKNCEVVIHNLASFIRDNISLVYLKTGEIVKTPYEIIGNNVFICMRNSTFVFHHSSKVQSFLTTAGVALSLLFLAMTLITHLVHRSLRTLPGIMLMNLCAILFVAQLLFVAVIGHISHRLACQVAAMVMHYVWLATFFWMNAIAINLTLTFAGRMTAIVSSGNLRRKLLKYSAYAYGFPAIVVIICGSLDKFGDIPIGYGPDLNEEGACWFTKELGLVYTFILPIALLIGTNAVLFTVTSVAIARAKRLGEKAKNGARGSKLEFVLYFKLSLLMGFTWIFGFVGTFTDNAVIWYFFIILNTLQGVFIGLAFACNKRIFGMWRGVSTVSSAASFSRSSISRATTQTTNV